MTNDPEKQKENEISLLDIFTVLLRYRKMICAVVFCSVIAVIAGYFIYPSRQKNESASKKAFETGITLIPVPGVRYLLANQSVVPYFVYPHVIQDTFKETQGVSLKIGELQQWIPVFGTTVGDDRNYVSANNKLLLKENVRSGVVEFTYKGNDSESGIIFLQSLLLHGSMALENYIIPLSKSFVDTFESTSLPSGDLNNYAMVKAIAEGKINVVVQLFESYVLEQDSTSVRSMRYYKLALLIIFAAVFFSILLAFCLNVVRNIKADQDAMRKINEALGKRND